MAMKIGEKIKKLRKNKNISQEALACVLGVTFQAVSKWETGAAMPDLGLIPAIASFFGVSIDELFDYNTLENEKKVDTICREAAKYRMSDPTRAEEILREGLKQFPANENMLTVLVYVLWAIPGRDADLIGTCRLLIEQATNEGIRCDVLRILAEACHRMGKQEDIPGILNQIPEFYFTKTECIARLTTGQESLDAARLQMNLSGKSMIEMLEIMEKHYAQSGDEEKAQLCRKLTQGVLDIFRRENGKTLELPGYEWME